MHNKTYAHFLISAVLISLLSSVTAASAAWTAYMPQQAPDFFFAADKSHNTLSIVQKKNNSLSVTDSMECIHGKIEGDKEKEGDMKTPEGVYVITHKITQKLDFMEYGPHAFALNYPNPVDRLRKKTGSGIWLHSKGKNITGLTTRGCLAIDQNKITTLVPLLTPGTPILIAENIAGEGLVPSYYSQQYLPHTRSSVFTPLSDIQNPSSENICAMPTAHTSLDCQELNSTKKHISLENFFENSITNDIHTIYTQTQQWIQDLIQNSKHIFELYDQVQWKDANKESFNRHKKNIITLQNNNISIDIDNNNIYIIPGPGYIVSFFNYTINTSKERIKINHILYWIHNNNGLYRIIGELQIK
jgi:L,D-peptidoglycan transpeptidase YkuD (ErfK/YbiS/YcfS/YnhG family)